jgi:signal transduction histidine kinase
MLRNIKVWQKMFLICISFIIPEGTLLYFLIQEGNISIDFAAKELTGDEYLKPLRRALEDMQQYKGLSRLYLLEKNSGKDKLLEKQAELDRDFQAIAQADRKWGVNLETTPLMNSLQSRWQEAKDGLERRDASADDQANTGLIAAIRELYAHAGDTSNLILDPDLDSYYTMDNVVNKIMDNADLISQLNDFVPGVGEGPTPLLPVNEKLRLAVLVGALKANQVGMIKGTKVALENNPAGNLKPALGQFFDEDVDATGNLVKATEQSLLNQGKAASIEEWRRLANEAALANYQFWDSSVKELDQLLNNRIMSFKRKRLMILLSVMLVYLLAYALVVKIVNSITSPLKEVVDRIKIISRGEGDLTKRLEVFGKDEIGEVAESFNTFVGKLQTVADMKLDLISVVSHQLKTPVAEINGFIENMLEGLTGELNPKQKRYLGEMRLIGRDNYKLISDLLSVSKIDRGIISLDIHPVSAKEVVSLAIRDYEQNMKEKGLSLRLEGMEDDITLYADRDKVVEVLRNLLNNAIKCTDSGSVAIRVGSEGDQGVIEVRDTGIGMDEETLGSLFTKNRVLGKEAHRSGAGLGLYISKHFMNIQKGDITVTSEIGKGSCFKLVVPKYIKQEGNAA